MGLRERVVAQMRVRKGSLEWSLETVGKMIFYVLILIALVYMTYELTTILTGSERDSRARTNLKLLMERIEDAERDGEAGLVMAMPPYQVIFGFDQDVTVEMQYKHPVYGQAVKRPEECDGTCLCIINLEERDDKSVIAPKVTHCESIDHDGVRGLLSVDGLNDLCTHGLGGCKDYIDLPTLGSIDGQQTYPLVVPEGIVFAEIRVVDDIVLVDFE